MDMNISRQRQLDHEPRDIIPISPSFDYIRRTFWDDLLSTYSATHEQS